MFAIDEKPKIVDIESDLIKELDELYNLVDQHNAMRRDIKIPDE